MTRRARDPEYEPLTTDDAEPPGYHDGVDDHDYDGQPHAAADDGFSWAEYAIFTLLGIAMLWAWCVLPPL